MKGKQNSRQPTWEGALEWREGKVSEAGGSMAAPRGGPSALTRKAIAAPARRAEQHPAQPEVCTFLSMNYKLELWIKGQKYEAFSTLTCLKDIHLGQREGMTWASG